MAAKKKQQTSGVATEQRKKLELLLLYVDSETLREVFNALADPSVSFADFEGALDRWLSHLQLLPSKDDGEPFNPMKRVISWDALRLAKSLIDAAIEMEAAGPASSSAKKKRTRLERALKAWEAPTEPQGKLARRLQLMRQIDQIVANGNAHSFDDDPGLITDPMVHKLIVPILHAWANKNPGARRSDGLPSKYELVARLCRYWGDNVSKERLEKDWSEANRVERNGSKARTKRPNTPDA